jgi:hypothetical protein
MEGIRRSLFGRIVLQTGLVSEDQIAECLALQERLRSEGKRVPRLGELMASKGFLTVDQVKALLQKQRDAQRQKQQAQTEKTASETSGKKCIGKYELLQKLGEDATGITYRARDPERDATVSLRVVNREAMDDPEYVERFRAAAKNAAKLRHPNIARLLAAGAAGGQLYYTAEFVQGISLRRLIETRGRLEPAFVLDVADAIAGALECGHARGVFHQDLNPSRILILPDKSIKLTGFGSVPDPIRNLRQLVETVGDMPFYVAPEQAVGEETDVADARSDIYSLGAILYHALGGQPPFHGESVEEVLIHLSEEDLVPLTMLLPELPESLDTMVQTMLQPDPDDRYQSASRVRDVIQEVRAELQFAGDTEPVPPRSGTGAALAAAGAGARAPQSSAQLAAAPARPTTPRQAQRERRTNRVGKSRARQHVADKKGPGAITILLCVIGLGIILYIAIFFIPSALEERAEERRRLRAERERIEAERQAALEKSSFQNDSAAEKKEAAPGSTPKKAAAAAGTAAAAPADEDEAGSEEAPTEAAAPAEEEEEEEGDYVEIVNDQGEIVRVPVDEAPMPTPPGRHETLDEAEAAERRTESRRDRMRERMEGIDLDADP